MSPARPDPTRLPTDVVCSVSGNEVHLKQDTIHPQSMKQLLKRDMEELIVLLQSTCYKTGFKAVRYITFFLCVGSGPEDQSFVYLQTVLVVLDHNLYACVEIC